MCIFHYNFHPFMKYKVTSELQLINPFTIPISMKCDYILCIYVYICRERETERETALSEVFWLSNLNIFFSQETQYSIFLPALHTFLIKMC